MLYVLMEVRQETDYAPLHIQKVLCFFAAMRRFVRRCTIGPSRPVPTLGRCAQHPAYSREPAWILKAAHGATRFGYQLPDAYRLDEQLKPFAERSGRRVEVADTEHFLTQRDELAALFQGRSST